MKKEQESSKKVSMEITILKVAEELFVEKGYSATSTVEIASKAGCNQALVHYYFRTKANLFNKILESKISFMVSAFDYIDNKELSFTENLTKTIEMHFDALTKDKKLPIFVLNEIKNNDNNNVLDIKIQSDGKILVGGQFTSYNSINQNYIIRLNSDGTRDNSFNSGGTNVNGSVQNIYLDNDINAEMIYNTIWYIVRGWLNERKNCSSVFYDFHNAFVLLCAKIVTTYWNWRISF